MTIDISDNNPRISYTVAAGVTQTSFAVPFEFFANTDLNVYVDGVLKTITTDYTVTGGEGSTGTVTISVTGPATVTLTRDTTIERVTDFPTGIDINRAALNTQLDTLTAISADVKDLANRAIRVNDFDLATNLELPTVANRADKVLSFDTEGNVQAQAASDLFSGSILGANYVNNTATGDGATVAFGVTVAPGSKNNIQIYIDGVYQNKATFSISGTTVTFSEAPPLNAAIEFIIGSAVTSISGDADSITYTQGGTGSQQRTVENKLQEFVSVKDFGAVGDGVTDDSSAIQTAIDSGHNIFFPQGRYKVSSTLTVTRDNVYLKGVGQNAYGSVAHNDACSEILFDCDPGIQFGFSGASAFIFGFRIHDMAFSGTSSCGTAIEQTFYKNYCALGDFQNLMFSRDFTRALYLNPVSCLFRNIRVGEAYAATGGSSNLGIVFEFEGTNGVAEGDGVARSVNANTIDFCDFRNCDTAIKVSYGSKLNITNSRCETLDDFAFIFYGLRDVNIDGCYFENMGAATHLIETATYLGRGVYSMRFTNNLVTATPNFVGPLTTGNWAGNIAIIGNEFLSNLGSFVLNRNTYREVADNDVRVGSSTITHKTAYHLTTSYELDGTAATTHNFTRNIPEQGTYIVHVLARATADLNHTGTRTFLVHYYDAGTNDLLTVENLTAFKSSSGSTRVTDIVINSIAANGDLDVEVTSASWSMDCQVTFTPLFINADGALGTSGGM